MGYGKVGVSKDEMCSYKHTHNSAELKTNLKKNDFKKY
jgi:hypothetical protein